MDKQTFFNNLHTELAEKYNTTSEVIGWCRILQLTDGFTPKQAALHVLDRAKLSRKNRHFNIKKHQEVAAFISKLTQIQWNDITQKTQYDKP
jgi:hypothetical protein